MHDPLRALVPSWQLAMEAENEARKTIKSYTESVEMFARWLTEHGHGLDPGEATVDQVRAFLVDVIETRSASTARTRWSGLRTFFAWAMEEHEVAFNPMELVKAPTLPQKIVPVLDPMDFATLISACQGPVPAGLPRRGDSLDVRRHRRPAVGDRPRATGGPRPAGTHLARGRDGIQGAGPALRGQDRTGCRWYLRLRNRSKFAHGPWLWISAKDGRGLTADAVYQMVRRRAVQAGLEGVHPHLFRHGFADAWLRSGGSEGDLMELAGWESRQMLQRYGAARRAERAREAYRSRSPMDRLG